MLHNGKGNSREKKGKRAEVAFREHDAKQFAFGMGMFINIIWNLIFISMRELSHIINLAFRELNRNLQIRKSKKFKPSISCVKAKNKFHTHIY